MSINEVERIKNLIEEAKTKKAKSEGIIEKIKSVWKEKYGTDDVEEIKNKLKEMKTELTESDERKEVIFNKLLKSNDWDKLEVELGF